MEQRERGKGETERERKSIIFSGPFTRLQKCPTYSVTLMVLYNVIRVIIWIIKRLII